MKKRLSPLLGLCLGSLLTGMLTGVVGAGFRFCLERAEAIRNEILQWAHQWPQAGWLVPVFGAAACAALARYLVVRFAPIAAGSGVQRVEAVIRGEAEPATWRVVPVKFFGGVLAIGSGAALGPAWQSATLLGIDSTKWQPVLINQGKALLEIYLFCAVDLYRGFHQIGVPSN